MEDSTVMTAANPSMKTTAGQRSGSGRVESKNCPPSKVVIRRLPPSMTLDTFVDQISPVPDNDYLHFVKADMSLGQFAFSRAYINFCNQDDIFVFKDKFDDYVFVDSKGAEYSAVVEFAPFPKVPKRKPKKVDAKCSTIEQDPEYLKFLESLKNPEEVSLPSAEFFLEEIENRERELRANSGSRNFTTPLIEFLREKKAEKVRVREERREERRRREVEKKRMKEEERRRKKADRERERERSNARERTLARDGKQANGGVVTDKVKMAEPAVKLLKNPERERPKELENEASPLVPSTENEGLPADTVSSPLSKMSKRNGVQSRQRASPAVKDWSAEVDRDRSRRREDGRSRDKQRDYRRPRRGGDQHAAADEEQQPLQQSSSSSRSAQAKDGTKSTSGASRSSTDWHRGAHGTGGVASGGHSSASNRANQGKGKSYEKSRQESLVSAKARNDQLQPGRSTGRTGASSAARSSAKDDDRRKFTTASASMPVDGSAGCMAHVEIHERDSSNRRPTTALEAEDLQMTAKCDAEVAETSYRRERSSRDPRTERRIRNKDRPSIELYRPGMRRMSQQWSGNQKESSSSSPSPTTVQTIGDVAVKEVGGSFPATVEDSLLLTIDDHQI